MTSTKDAHFIAAQGRFLVTEYRQTMNVDDVYIFERAVSKNGINGIVYTTKVGPNVLAFVFNPKATTHELVYEGFTFDISFDVNPNGSINSVISVLDMAFYYGVDAFVKAIDLDKDKFYKVYHAAKNIGFPLLLVEYIALLRGFEFHDRLVWARYAPSRKREIAENLALRYPSVESVYMDMIEENV